MKSIATALLITTSSLFALHPIADYTECQQPYVKKLRNGDALALKNSIVECRAMLWNEDMKYYSSFNYKKLSETSLTCVGDLHSKEVLRGHKRSLRYAASLYRISASKGNKDAKINLIYLKDNGSKVLFMDETEKEYTKVFDENKESQTFLQILNGTKNVKKEDRQSYMDKYHKQLVDYTGSCVVSLQKDLDMLNEEQETLNEYLSKMSIGKQDKDLEKYQNIWLNLEDRVIRAEIDILKSSLRKFTGMNKKISDM